MNIPLDKQAHFFWGYAIAVTIALLTHNIYFGFAAAMIAEALKIVAIDMPATKKANEVMDWPEKGWDAVAQALGGVAAVAFIVWRSLL